MTDNQATPAVPTIGVLAEPGFALVPYRVRFDESSPGGVVRTSAYLRYAQDIAWVHSEHLGYDRRWYAERGLAWLVRSAELAVLDDVLTGETVLLRTQVVGFRKVWARRRTEVRRLADPSGPLVAWLHTDWVMTDGRGAPTRVPPDFAARFGEPPGSFDPVRVPLPAPPGEAVTRELAVRPQELDPMDHVNNSVYVDWVDEAAADVEPSAITTSPRRYRLEYLVPAGPGDVLWASVWRVDETGTLAFRVTTTGGAEVLRATLDREGDVEG